MATAVLLKEEVMLLADIFPIIPKNLSIIRDDSFVINVIYAGVRKAKPITITNKKIILIIKFFPNKYIIPPPRDIIIIPTPKAQWGLEDIKVIGII